MTFRRVTSEKLANEQNRNRHNKLFETFYGKGNIEATASPDKDSYYFTNEYQAAGEVNLKAKKAVTGASWPKGGKVTFTVTAAKGIPMPEKTSLMLTEAVLQTSEQ